MTTVNKISSSMWSQLGDAINAVTRPTISALTHKAISKRPSQQTQYVPCSSARLDAGVKGSSLGCKAITGAAAGVGKLAGAGVQQEGGLAGVQGRVTGLLPKGCQKAAPIAFACRQTSCMLTAIPVLISIPFPIANSNL